MKITFYHSSLCPRCRATRKILLRMVGDNRELELEEIDVLRHPLAAWSDGIRIFPALKIGDRMLAGVLLGEKKIKAFLQEPR